MDTSYGCIVCHADKRRAFVVGVHAERGIRCHDCHGGTPTAYETRAAHTRGFIGDPGKVRTVAICSSCHADPNRMRQYGVSTGQLAELRTSRHGQLLLQRGDTAAPTCTDCHDAHTILPPVDARSSVNPVNIPGTCGRCHEDQRLMARYGLPTNQLAEFRRSAHGVALFENRDFAAPTCVGCHGSHGALPPRVTEIANVCGHCHALVGRAFAAGPHAASARAGRLPGCLACHSNHGTERVPPEQLAALCARCHEQNSPAAALAQQVQQEIVRVTEELRVAEVALEELVRSGEPVVDTRFRYQTALTYFRQVAQVQHNLDLEQLSDLTRRAGSIARDIRAVAEARRERRWEHRLFLIPVWFFTLAAVTIAGFKLADLRRRGE
ncbi:MAG: cytochrome c3 family protein [Gemmatimonadetes bacterium]|nr:cytochrome c3 family protein [Gemmatimonadota bacterium]